MSKIEYRVCTKITQRAALGKEKYGTTMERDDLTPLDWLKHAQEEAMDLAVYLEKLMQELEELQSMSDKDENNNSSSNESDSNSNSGNSTPYRDDSNTYVERS